MRLCVPVEVERTMVSHRLRSRVVRLCVPVEVERTIVSHRLRCRVVRLRVPVEGERTRQQETGWPHSTIGRLGRGSPSTGRTHCCPLLSTL